MYTDMTKSFLAILGALTITFIPSPSKAEWVAVAEGTGAILYVNDRIQVRTTTDEPTFFWAKMVYKKRQTDGTQWAISHNAVQCNPMASQIRQIVQYNNQGAVIKSTDYDDELRWEPPIPGSLLEAAIETVCSN